jgi:hypothetical protein
MACITSLRTKGFCLSADTAVCAVETMRTWWYAEAIVAYEEAAKIVLTADCGGSNGYRNRL